MSNLPCIAITSGEPAGIGLDICVKLAYQTVPARLVILADVAALHARAAQLGLPLEAYPFEQSTKAHAGDGRLCVLDVNAPGSIVAGTLNAKTAPTY